MALRKHKGNSPRTVSKAAKYRVKRSDGDWAIQLQYVLSNTERALLTTDEHPALIDMVNVVKVETNQTPGGAFYINEYGKVIVPSSGADYFVAGEYSALLEFDFEGSRVSGRPPSDLEPGAPWHGPRVGIPYMLAASGSDIKYKIRYGNIEKTVLLSDAVGEEDAGRLAGRLSRIKRDGGRIYINECREFFAPTATDDGWSYVYLGPLGGDSWFPEPS